jgi:hypothetical protein
LKGRARSESLRTTSLRIVLCATEALMAAVEGFAARWVFGGA